MSKRKPLIITIILAILLMSLVSSTSSYLYIVLNNPSDNAWINTSDVLFYYVPYADVSIENCSLNLNSAFNQIDNSISQGVENNFATNLDEGYYLWSIDCFTTPNNSTNSSIPYFNSSEERAIYVDNTAPVVDIINPEDGKKTAKSDVEFMFNISDNLDDEVLCQVEIDSSTHNLTTTNGINTLDVSLSTLGNYSWNLACWDHAYNSFNQDNMNLELISDAVSFNIVTDKSMYNINEQVDIIITAPIGTELDIEIYDSETGQQIDVFTTTITNTQTTFFRNFDEGGNYDINSSFDYYDHIEQKKVSFEVIDSQLSASIVVDDSVVRVGQDIHFEAVASNSIGTLSYKWDFTNDGNIDSTSREVDYDYDNDGTKTVNLTIEDDFGVASTTRIISVRDQFTLEITVLENVTDAKINNATIEIDSDTNYTNSNGEFSTPLLEDDYSIAVRKTGYYTYYDDIELDENKDITIKLRKRDTDIAPPEIILISPINNEVISQDSASLKFKVIDESDFDCALYYSEYANWYQSIEVNKTVENNTETIVNFEELIEGKNYWKVECIDIFNNEGTSENFVFTVDLNSQESTIATTSSGDSDDLGVISNNLVKEIDNTLNTISEFSPEQKDIADAIDLRKHLDEAKNELQKLRSDLHNLQFLDLSASGLSEEEKSIEVGIQLVEDTTIRSIRVVNSADYTRYPSEGDVERLSQEYVSATNPELSKRKINEFIQNNKDAQSLATISTKAWNAELEFLSGEKELITIIEKTVLANGDYSGYSFIEFIPKEVAQNVNEIEFFDLFTVIKSDPIVKINLDKNNKTTYLIRAAVSLANIDAINTLLISEELEGEDSSSKVTGFASLGAAGGITTLGIIVIILFVLIGGGFYAYQKDLIEIDKKIFNNLKERIQSRSDITRIRELTDLAHNKLRGNQSKEAHRIYGEINLIYREIPTSCRNIVFGDLAGLSKQIDFHHLNSIMDDAKNSLKFNQIEMANDYYNKAKKVYNRFDEPQKNRVKNDMLGLFNDIKKAHDRKK